MDTIAARDHSQNNTGSAARDGSRICALQKTHHSSIIVGIIFPLSGFHHLRSGITHVCQRVSGWEVGGPVGDDAAGRQRIRHHGEEKLVGLRDVSIQGEGTQGEVKVGDIVGHRRQLVCAYQVITCTGADVKRRALHRLRIKAGGGGGCRVKRIGGRKGCQGKIHAGPADRAAQVVRHQPRNRGIGRQAEVDVGHAGGTHRDHLVGGIGVGNRAGAHIPGAVDDAVGIAAIGTGDGRDDRVGGGIGCGRNINGNASQRCPAAVGHKTRDIIRGNAH